MITTVISLTKATAEGNSDKVMSSFLKKYEMTTPVTKDDKSKEKE